MSTLKDLEEQKKQLLAQYSDLIDQHMDDVTFKDEAGKLWEQIKAVHNEINNYSSLKAIINSAINIKAATSGDKMGDDTVLPVKEDQQADPFCQHEQEEAKPIEVEEHNNMDILCSRCVNFHPRKV